MDTESYQVALSGTKDAIRKSTLEGEFSEQQKRVARNRELVVASFLPDEYHSLPKERLSELEAIAIYLYARCFAVRSLVSISDAVYCAKFFDFLFAQPDCQDLMLRLHHRVCLIAVRSLINRYSSCLISFL